MTEEIETIASPICVTLPLEAKHGTLVTLGRGDEKVTFMFYAPEETLEEEHRWIELHQISRAKIKSANKKPYYYRK